MSCPILISKTSDLSTSTKSSVSSNCLNIGSTGLNGLDGENGLPGMSVNGPTGIIGPIGEVIDGQTGPTGPKGLNGTNGENGPRGPTGIYGKFISSINISEGSIFNTTIINPNMSITSPTITKIGSITLPLSTIYYYILAQCKFNISAANSGPVLVLGISDVNNATLDTFKNCGMSNTYVSYSTQTTYCQCSCTMSNSTTGILTVYLYAYFSFYENMNLNAEIISGSIQSFQISFLYQ
jgi:hypothetical protein